MSGMKVFYGLALLLSSFGIDMGLSQVLLNFVYSLPNSRKNETEGAWLLCASFLNRVPCVACVRGNHHADAFRPQPT